MLAPTRPPRPRRRVHEFQSDVDLILDNSVRFNGATHDITNNAHAVVELIRVEMEKHAQECPDTKLECPNEGCGQIIRRCMVTLCADLAVLL